MAARQDTGSFALAGNLLVASPNTAARYHRSVVLLLAHDENGAQGILLNDQILRVVDSLGQHIVNLGERAAHISFAPVELKVRLVQWEAGQLDQEYERGIWMTIPATLERLHDARGTGNLWGTLVRQIGRSVLRDALNIRDFPRNPSLN